MELGLFSFHKFIFRKLPLKIRIVILLLILNETRMTTFVKRSSRNQRDNLTLTIKYYRTLFLKKSEKIEYLIWIEDI